MQPVESWSCRTHFGWFVLGFWGMFTAPADVKLVRHLPMKGPRQVKQVVFPLLTAGSSSPESSELQPNPDVSGLLHQDLAG